MPTTLSTDTPRRLFAPVSRFTDSRLLSNVSWTFLGNAFYAASQWAMLVVLARCTNPQIVGALALALAITAPIMILFNMQLRAVIATDVTSNYGLCDYFHTRLLSTTGAVTIILVCVALSGTSASTKAVIILEIGRAHV